MHHILGLFLNPANEWQKIRKESGGIASHYLKFILIIALLPACAWYFGATRVGWTIGADRVVKLTTASALEISLLFYLAMLTGIGILGYMIHWMAHTYEAESSVARGVQIAAYTCVPLFICGGIGFYPILWLDILLGIGAGFYTVYLLYIGVPIVMQIPKERGFLFASAMVAVGLVMVAGMLGATVILWEMGAMPVFTD
ncbi:MAG: Yip1 family protein [Gammaproteobacteria bacterium]|nr:Yip1 family protein [Gammaproteobacteria bacterium]